jgi:ATP-dependent Clp protease ATP-binding subunit ClpB
MNAVKAHFRPEFLNRISSMVVFNRLSKKAIRQIVKIRVKEIEQRFMANNKNLKLELDEDCYEYLVQHGYSNDLGARPLNRLIQNEVLNKLAILLLRGQVKDNEVVKVIKGPKGLEVVPNHEAENTDEVMDVDENEEDEDMPMTDSDLD